jgi:dihydroorotase-like cyclic amidohydrolase
MEQVPDWEKMLSMVIIGRTSEVFGLSDREGISEGKRADLVILDGPGIINADLFESKARYSPFNGMEMPVTIYKTISGGSINE